MDSEKPNYIYKYIPKESSKRIIEQTLDISIWEELRKNLRFSSKAKIIKLEKIKDIRQTKKFNLYEDSQVWEIVFQDNNSVLSLEVSPVISKGHSHKKMATKEHLMFSFLIHQAHLDLKVFDFDALSLFHIIYDGLTIPIEFLNTVNDSNKRFEYLEILSDQKIRFVELI